MPENERVEVSAPHRFRMQLVDPATGKTIRACRSGEGTVCIFNAPHYKGDGTRCRALSLEIVMYDCDRAVRMKSSFLVPPRSCDAKALLSLSGADARAHPEYRTILSNGTGAASQVRVGWGVIASQYDAFLAANPNPDVPSDRLNLWARTRCWLQREGYTRELDAKCVRRFTADPAGRFARWEFHVPCGMGHETAFEFELSLVRGENMAHLAVRRVDSGADDVGDQIRLVFRPDVEWRSFHATTKAYAGLDELFPKSCTPVADGVEFSPYDGKFRLSVAGGVYHHEPQWEYNVPHPEDAARGQDGVGDLFSPGWISADLKVGDAVVIAGELCGKDGAGGMMRGVVALDGSRLAATVLPLAEALRESLDLFIVRRDDLKTVIAGYPWFLDWGRDTFIFMRGMIAAGMIGDSVKILQAFASFEENGTLPNIIYGKTAGNRDTTDAQLWFIRCVEELEAAAGASAATARLRKTCESIVDNYTKGTSNGIKVDSASGLVWSPSHFTWMDTNYPACTPRVGYPVEIQALWISALRFLGRDDLAAKALGSLKRLFKRKEASGYFDCLAAPNGESAADATPEDAIRPNQLFLITLGILDDPSILRATEELLVPGGMRSLNAGHPLYCGVYEGDEDTRRKPAYHNGTVWGWVFPLYAEALFKTDACSRESALSLLASSVENLNAGCLCHVSENADGDAPHAQKGCTAQAWSDSELLRVWLHLAG